MSMFKPRGRPPTPKGPETAPPIAERIDAAEHRLADLQSQHGPAAIEWAQGIEGAADRLAAIEQDITDVERELARLRVAHDEAVAADQRMLAQQRAAIQAAQLRKVKREFELRDDAALRLSVAIENAVSAYRDLILHSRAATRACPLGSTWPNGSLCGDGELQRAVDQEMFRLGDTDPVERIPSFPRMDRYLLAHPNKVVPLAERVRRQSAITLANLKGEPAPAAAVEPVTVEQQPAETETVDY